jgi:predicted nucleotidyltransferase component of viral defense system
MIPKAYITEWRNKIPWKLDSQIEQDLILDRVLIELFSNKIILDKLLFRGGTSLYKLFSKNPVRYSEDIDLVQKDPLPIGDIMTEVRSVCDGFLGVPRYKQTEGRVVLTYRVDSEIPPIIPIKIKIEINTREHFTVFGVNKKLFKSDSRWFSGECSIPTYSIEELLGTKLRALYQRNKGRDLFDLWFVLKNHEINKQNIIKSFKKYTAHQGVKITKKQFIRNIDDKMMNSNFINDIDMLIRPEINYTSEMGYELVMESLINRL